MRTVGRLAALDPAAAPPMPESAQLFPDMVVLARAWLRGLPVVRRVPRVPVLRADVEVDVDMESFGESGAYLWGRCCATPAAGGPATSRAGYRAFATWDPLPTSDEARSFAEFWAWFSGVRAQAAATGRTFAAYCYNAQAENRWLLGSAQRFAGRPGVPDLAEVERFVADPRGSTCTRWSTSGSSARTARGSSASPRWPGSPGAIPRRAGRTPCAGTATPSGWTARRPTTASGPGCWSTTPTTSPPPPRLRDWMTSDAIEVVPLASDL